MRVGAGAEDDRVAVLEVAMTLAELRDLGGTAEGELHRPEEDDLPALPRLAVPTEAARIGLRVRAFAEPAPHRTIGLVWRRGCPLAPALRQVATTLREAYPEERT